MGGNIKYQGRIIAHYNMCMMPENPFGPDVPKFNLKFNSLEDLEALLGAKPGDKVEVDGEEMPYARFREEILRKINRIYTSRMAEVLDLPRVKITETL